MPRYDPINFEDNLFIGVQYSRGWVGSI